MAIQAGDIQEALEVVLPEGWAVEMVPIRSWFETVEGKLVQLDTPVVIGYEVVLRCEDKQPVELYFKLASAKLESFVANALESIGVSKDVMDPDVYSELHSVQGAAA